MEVGEREEEEGEKKGEGGGGEKNGEEGVGEGEGAAMLETVVKGLCDEAAHPWLLWKKLSHAQMQKLREREGDFEVAP